MKRIFDVIGSALGLALLAPLMAVLAALILVRDGPPVLFKQERAGLRGKPFTLYKFRTMAPPSDTADDPRTDAERLTTLGRWLRRTSLDELPELYNVLRGDMSLVGPRPLLTEYIPLYTKEQARRHEVRPGLTGWAQVHGRNEVSWEERFRLDVWYVDNRSLRLDLSILFRTLWTVVSGRGISERGQATMSKYRGTQL